VYVNADNRQILHKSSRAVFKSYEICFTLMIQIMQNLAPALDFHRIILIPEQVYYIMNKIIISCILHVCYYTKFRDPRLRGVSIAPISKILMEIKK
jgi:hypothetical protein